LKGELILNKKVIKTLVLIVFIIALFFSYPVNMSRENKKHVEEQIEHMKEDMYTDMDGVAFAHVSYTGKSSTDNGYVIYAFCATNYCYIGNTEGKVHIKEAGDVECCIYTDKNYNILKIEYPFNVTSKEYRKSRRKMFPLPIRIRMIGESGSSYKAKDLESARQILKKQLN
jgi:hypothetical protein